MEDRPLESSETFLVWGVDDLEGNLEMIRATLLPEFAAYVRVECFLDANEALAELGRRRDAGADVPHVILMDFFLGVAYGTEVTSAIRALFGAEPGPVIVGHSSERSASRAIVEAGGDFILSKRKCGPCSAPLRELFSDRARVSELIRARRSVRQ